MREFKYTPPRVHSGQLRTPVHFYDFVANTGPEPGGGGEERVFTAWSKVDSVFLRDVELAKSQGTLSDITITMRDPLESFRPTNLHLIRVDHPDYKDVQYEVKSVQPDLENADFINVIAGVTT